MGNLENIPALIDVNVSFIRYLRSFFTREITSSIAMNMKKKGVAWKSFF